MRIGRRADALQSWSLGRLLYESHEDGLSSIGEDGAQNPELSQNLNEKADADGNCRAQQSKPRNQRQASQRRSGDGCHLQRHLLIEATSGGDHIAQEEATKPAPAAAESASRMADCAAYSGPKSRPRIQRPAMADPATVHNPSKTPMPAT